MHEIYIYDFYSYYMRISLYLASSSISRVNIYIYIYRIHSYCRRISLDLASSCISWVNMYIYMDKTFI